MRYQNLQVDILRIFAEAAHPPGWVTSRKVQAGIVPAAPRPVARIVQLIGRLPSLTTCIKCGRGITSEDPRVVQGHVKMCGVQPKHTPQRK